MMRRDDHYDIMLRKHSDDAGDESLAVCKLMNLNNESSHAPGKNKHEIENISVSGGFCYFDRLGYHKIHSQICPDF